MHKKVKITVLRTEYDQELAEQYAISYLGKCPFHQKGQVLYSDGINPPDGMCGVAWQVIAPMARRCPWGNQFSRLALGSMMIGLVCLHVQTASDLLFFSWRRSKECNGQTERFDAIG